MEEEEEQEEEEKQEAEGSYQESKKRKVTEPSIWLLWRGLLYHVSTTCSRNYSLLGLR